MRTLIGIAALCVYLSACAPIERVEPELTRSYPVGLAPSVMPGLPEVLVSYQDDWPAYWKGTVKGTRALDEAGVSVWLVELLGPPISRSPYCVAEGATWEYDVIEGGVVDRGSAPTAAAHRLEAGDDCMATQDARYFSVEPSLIDAFPDVLDASARVLACVEAPAPGCPTLGSRAEILSPLAGQDPYDPLSVHALGRDAARVLYTLPGSDRTEVFNLDFRRTADGWSLSGADRASIERSP